MALLQAWAGVGALTFAARRFVALDFSDPSVGSRSQDIRSGKNDEENSSLEDVDDGDRRVVAKAVKQEGWGFTAWWLREGVNRRLREE